MKASPLIVLSAIVLISGCSTLKLTPGGDKVRVLDPGEVGTCRNLGKTNTSVTHVLLGVPRPIETVSKELRVIARNSAARMGGDTIVALTVIDQGAQTFEVYKCVDPAG